MLVSWKLIVELVVWGPVVCIFVIPKNERDWDS